MNHKLTNTPKKYSFREINENHPTLNYETEISDNKKLIGILAKDQAIQTSKINEKEIILGIRNRDNNIVYWKFSEDLNTKPTLYVFINKENKLQGFYKEINIETSKIIKGIGNIPPLPEIQTAFNAKNNYDRLGILRTIPKGNILAYLDKDHIQQILSKKENPLELQIKNTNNLFKKSQKTIT